MRNLLLATVFAAFSALTVAHAAESFDNSPAGFVRAPGKNGGALFLTSAAAISITQPSGLGNTPAPRCLKYSWRQVRDDIWMCATPSNTTAICGTGKPTTTTSPSGWVLLNQKVDGLKLAQISSATTLTSATFLGLSDSVMFQADPSSSQPSPLTYSWYQCN